VYGQNHRLWTTNEDHRNLKYIFGPNWQTNMFSPKQKKCVWGVILGCVRQAISLLYIGPPWSKGPSI
jgi:hypothetical protein